jgi:hypothetical protein
MKRVPMITGVLAGLTGFLSVKGNNLSILANYNSTQAVLHQSQASDHWAEYQADSVKKNLEESLALTVADDAVKKKLRDEADGFGGRQPALKQKALDQESLREQELANSEQKLRVKGLLDYAGMAAQVGIALASVAALTKTRVWYQVGLFAGILAFLITGYAIAYPYLLSLLKHG